jgi:hypothetical protein
MSLRLALCFSLLALALTLSPPVLAEDHRGGIDPNGLKLADGGDSRGTIDPNGVA